VYFQTFFKDVAPQFQDYAPFWHFARKESKSSYSIRHGLVALGALSKSAKRSPSNHYRVDLTQGTHREIALEQYQKALQSLRESIPGIDQGNPVRTTLVSCLILSCFENFLGNVGFSLQHITWARHVLTASETSRATSSTSTTNVVGEGEDIVMSCFYLMDLQALCLLGADESRTYFKFDQASPIVSMPAILNNLDEAKNARHVLVWNGYKAWYNTDFYQYGPKEAIPPSTIEVRDYLVGQLHALHEQIDLLLLGSTSDPHHHPLARPEAIKVYSTTLLIRLAMSLQAPQSTSDLLLAEFEYLLGMARSALEYEAEGVQMIQGVFITILLAIMSLSPSGIYSRPRQYLTQGQKARYTVWKSVHLTYYISSPQNVASLQYDSKLLLFYSQYIVGNPCMTPFWRARSVNG
jgi:hypothetical protein